jgi:hypothetical protein
VKAMEAVKTLEVQREGLPGVRGRGTFRRWRRELGRRSVLRGTRMARLITGVEPGSGLGAGRESEAVTVLVEPGGQQNRR